MRKRDLAELASDISSAYQVNKFEPQYTYNYWWVDFSLAYGWAATAGPKDNIAEPKVHVFD
jgi:hypothetical protein